MRAFICLACYLVCGFSLHAEREGLHIFVDSDERDEASPDKGAPGSISRTVRSAAEPIRLPIINIGKAASIDVVKIWKFC